MPKLIEEVRWEEEIGNSLVLREPIGVVGAITPWNYPLHQIACKVAPALAAGCTVVLKPSEIAPLNAFILAEVIEEAGLPAGVFNLVTGTGPVVGEAIAAHPGVDMVSFTGSTRAGRRVAELAAATVKPVALELGGKSPNVILDDADLSKAVPDGVGKCYLNSGQTCSALTRMLVPREKLAEAEQIAAQAAESFTPGDPFEDTTRLGPLVSEAQRERVRGYIEKGEAEGREAGHRRRRGARGPRQGYFVRPTVFSDVTPEMTIAQEEIFGPVLAILPYDAEDDAVRIANDTDYGLAGGVWSGDQERAIGGREADAHRPGRDQRRRVQPAGAVRRLQAVGPRARERPLRHRGVAAGQEPAAVAARRGCPAVNFELSDEQRLLRDTVREFALAEVKPVAEELDRTKSFPYEIVGKLGGLGLMGIPFPQEYGGGGADTLSYVLAVEELARIDSSVCITMAAHTSLGTMPIYLWGSDEQKSGVAAAPVHWRTARLLWADRARGWIGRWERADHGEARRRRMGRQRGQAVHHQLRDGHLRVRLDHRRHRRGEWAQRDLKFDRAQRNSRLRDWRGVPQDGLECLRHPAARLLRTAGCQKANLLGRRGEGFKNFLHILDGGRIGVAAMGVGLAQGALDEAISYAKERQAFGQAISKFQSIQAKIADLSAQIEAARLLTWRAALEKDAGKSFTLTAAQAKLITGRLAVRATEEAVQIHGGYGFIEEYPVCRFYRDAKILTIGEGTDEVQQMVIARQLGCR